MSRLLRYGRWIAGSVGAVSTVFVVAKCATKYDTEIPATANKTTTVYPSDYAPTTRWDFNWDRRDPQFLTKKVWEDSTPEAKDSEEEPKLQVPTARRNIILVRHGQYNQKGEEDRNHTLTPLGEEQAALAGKRLKDMGIKFDSIKSSGLIRAIQTAEIILKEFGETDLKLEVNDTILNEGAPCIPEPPYGNLAAWNPSYGDFFAEGARVEAAFRKYFHRADVDQEKDSYEIIVCHANVIRYFAVRALQFPPEAWLRISLDHASLTKINIFPNGDVTLRGLGDSGHMPPDKTTVV